MAALEEQHLLADRALGYVELYGAYTETDALYRVDRLLALWDRMDEDDRATFCLDPAAIDWTTYVREIHLPSIIEHARVRTSPGKSIKTNRADRARKNILSPDRHLAAFDLENTLIASNVVDSYAWLASRHLPPGERAAFVADLLAEAPQLLALDRRDRGDFLRSFYRRYEGAPEARLRDDGWDLFHHLLLAKSFPSGIARVRAHQALGHRTILITGALDFVVEPFRPLFDEIVCARARRRGRQVHRAPRDTAAHRRGPGPGPGRLRRGRGTPARGVDGLRRLGQRPPHARGRRLPGRREPRGQAGRHRPPARAGTWRPGTRPRAAASPCSPSGRSTGAVPPAAAGPVRRHGPDRRDGRPRRRGDEGARPRTQPAALRRVPGGLAARLRPGRGHRPAPAARRRRTGAARATTGTRCARCCRASAAPTWRRSTDARRATSRTSSASRSCPATRWWACSTRAAPTSPAVRSPPARRAVIEPVLGCAPRNIHPSATSAARATRGCAATSPSAPSSRGCRPASAPTPAAAGRPRR